MKNLLKDKDAPIGADYAVVSYDSVNEKITVKGGTPTPPQPTYEFVDLGLPSGLKWAKCNIGATSETDYGKYFQWGDVEGRTADEITSKPCSWSTAPFNNGSSSYDSTYFASVSGTVCPNGVLAKEYDAASVNMGGNWRMPTEAEFKELTANTNTSWETNFNGSGKNGYLFRSQKDMDKYIFIPAAGYASRGSVDYTGDHGNVWNSSLYTSNPINAWHMNFNSINVGMGSSNRYLGRSVRGVLAS